jgi:sugar phosphate isomerase/epimerase
MEHLGIQLWSLRREMEANLDAALDRVENWGLSEVETAGTAARPAAEFVAALREHGLTAVAAHESYEKLACDLVSVAQAAQILGVGFVICPNLPKTALPLNKESAGRLASKFNQWGKALSADGLRFGYHTHGSEFRPLDQDPASTGFDILMQETDAELVTFEMDVFWVRRGGVDPAKLLSKYPGRWSLLHLKDLRIDAPTGIYDSAAPASDKVPVGKGAINWPDVLRAARPAGVKHLFLEDETADALENIPISLEYLRNSSE